MDVDQSTNGAGGGRGIGRRQLLQAAGASAGAVALTGVLPAVADAAESGSRFVALPKAVRLVDTREPSGHLFDGGSENLFTRLAANHFSVKVVGRNGVPLDASAVVLTVTGLVIGEKGFITVYPKGPTVPTVSNLNLDRPGDVAANLVLVRVGESGSVNVFQQAPSHVVIDVLGYFVVAPGGSRGGRLKVRENARRVLDTRKTATPFTPNEGFTEVDVTGVVPDGASAFVNITAVEPRKAGFLSAVPYSVTRRPATSNLNVAFGGEMRAASAIVPIETHAGRQKFKVYSQMSAQLVVDIAGYFTPETASTSTDGLFVPLDPVRILDTRELAQPTRMWPKWVVEQPLSGAAANAQAVVVNVTATATRASGYLSVAGARSRNLSAPLATSNVNWQRAWSTVPNLAISPVTAVHGLEVYNHTGGHVVSDLAGYFLGSPKPARYPKYVNPPVPAVAPPWTITIPKLGLTHTVVGGDPNVVNTPGYSWHWTGTGDMGQNAHVSIFGHRTDAGGAYRYLHNLGVGDTWTVQCADAFSNREYTYRMVRRDITDANASNILAATRMHPAPVTMSIVACTRGVGPRPEEPTSLKYRLIVTGELVGWREV